jgi:small subunit ribosomal protein S6
LPDNPATKPVKEITLVREYEFTLITSGQLTEADTKTVLEKYENLLTAEGGQIIKKNVWGSRKLAFPIKKQYRGHYVNYDLAANSASIAEAERLMKIDDSVLRYLNVKLADEVNVDERKAEIAKAEVAAEQAKDA